MVSVALLLFIVIYLVLVLLLHCTPLIDALAKVPDTREYVLVTPGVMAVVGLSCSLLLIKTLWALVRISCLRRRLTERAVTKKASRRKSRFWIIRAIDWVRMWVTNPDAPFFEIFEFSREVCELGLQMLAVQSYSEVGVSQGFLYVFVLVLSANGISALLYLGSFRSWFRGGSNDAKDQISAARRVRIVVAVDVAADCFYGWFSAVEVFSTYFQVYGKWGGDVLCGGRSHTGSRYCTFIRGYFLQQTVTVNMFGGEHFGDILLKVLTRLVPFWFASIRLVEIVELRALAKYHKHRRHLPPLRVRTALTLSPRGPSKKKSTKSPQKPLRSPKSLLEMISGRTKQRTRKWSTFNAKGQASRPVPRVAVVLLAIVSCSFGVFALIRLSTVAEGCSEQIWQDACPTPAFPIFDLSLPQKGLCPCSMVMISGGEFRERAYMEKLRSKLWKNRTAISVYVRTLAISAVALNNRDVEEIVS